MIPNNDMASPEQRTTLLRYDFKWDRWRGLSANAFSFPVMCVFLLCAVIFAFCVKQFAEPDIWWHLLNASHIFQYHTIPTLDTYSFTAAGLPRIDFEWLSQLVFYLGFKTAGLQGILAIYSLVLAAIYIGVYYRSCRAGSDVKDATIATLGAIFLGVVSIGPRMLLFGWLCMMGLLLALDRFQRAGKGLWVIPPLFAVWANLHGSWVFGLVVLGLTIAAGLLTGEWGSVYAQRWSPGQLKRLLIVLAASLLALFVNPIGYRLVLYPFDLLLHQPGNMQIVEEWRSVDFGNGNGKLVLITVFLLLSAAWFSNRRWKLDQVLLTAFALWAGLSHVRLLFFLGLIATPILAPSLRLFPPYERRLDKPWLNAAIIALIVAGLIIFFPSKVQLQQRVDASYPRAALEFLKGQHLHGRVFNEYIWGGYMEWSAPDLKPFIDGRADIFANQGILGDHYKAITINNSFEILDKYKVDYVLVARHAPLEYLLEHSPEWSSIYADDLAAVFGRGQRDPRIAAQSRLQQEQRR